MNEVEISKNITQEDILTHADLQKSDLLVKDIVKKGVETFHHHYHIIYVLSKLLDRTFKLYVELGCYLGGSLLLASFAGGPQTKFCAIDTMVCPNQELTLNNNLKKFYSDISNFQLIKSSTNDRKTISLIKDISEKSDGIDILFIDASHTYKDVIYDFQTYFPYVRTGGFCIFDDYQSIPCVKAAVDKLIHDHSNVLNVIGSIPNTVDSHALYSLKGLNNTFIVQKK